MWSSNNGTLITRCVGERGTFGIISSNNGKSFFFQKSVSNISSPFWKEPLQRGKRTNSEHRVWVSITEQISTWKLDHKGQAVHRVSMTQTTGELGKIQQPAIWFINHLSDWHFTLKEAWTYDWMLCTAIHGMSHHINDMTIYLRLPYMTLFPIKRYLLSEFQLLSLCHWFKSLVLLMPFLEAIFHISVRYLITQLYIQNQATYLRSIPGHLTQCSHYLLYFHFFVWQLFFSSVGAQNIMAVSVLKLTPYK